MALQMEFLGLRAGEPSSVSLPRLDILVFFSGLKGTIFWYDKDPQMPFFF